jgi:hypothetical protein
MEFTNASNSDPEFRRCLSERRLADKLEEAIQNNEIYSARVSGIGHVSRDNQVQQVDLDSDQDEAAIHLWVNVLEI